MTTAWTNDAGTLPPLQHPGGLHGGYRLFNVNDLPWEDRGLVSAEAVEGRGIVVTDGWGTSQTTGGDLDGKVKLNAYRVPIDPEDGLDRHELDGTVYDTRLEATRAAYEAGITAFMVYEDRRIGAGA
jgi:hypothetical protein